MSEHIKMPDVTPLVRLLANGSRTEFEFPFPVFASEDVHVELDGAPQMTGFSIVGAGQTSGGSVVFTTAPASGIVVTVSRLMPFERLTDFIEGGDFAASAINTELDYLVAGLQQVSRAQNPMLKYADTEEPSLTTLPSRTMRANKALGFDGDGNPVAIPLTVNMAMPNFTASGTGAVQRTTTDKMVERVSVKDFGAMGDGTHDDTLAFQKALAAHMNVYVPSGTYIVNNTITLGDYQTLEGAGHSSVIQTASAITLIAIAGSYARLANLKLFGGVVGIKL
ncbi:MAG: phage tail fiber protein, partial [Pseudomonadota bacterium]